MRVGRRQGGWDGQAWAQEDREGSAAPMSPPGPFHALLMHQLGRHPTVSLLKVPFSATGSEPGRLPKGAVSGQVTYTPICPVLLTRHVGHLEISTQRI